MQLRMRGDEVREVVEKRLVVFEKRERHGDDGKDEYVKVWAVFCRARGILPTRCVVRLSG